MKKNNLIITHLVSTFPPYRGGMGAVAYNMAHFLQKRGISVSVITPEYSKEKKEVVKNQLDVQVKRITPRAAYGNAALVTHIDSDLDQCDVLHLHYPFYGASNIARRWKKRNPHKLLVITYHMDSYSPGWKGLIFRWYSQFYTPKLFKIADVITVNSFDYMYSSQMRKLFDKTQKKWKELPFGIDKKVFYEGEKDIDLLKRYQISAKLPLAVFVGGMDSAHYFKGVSVLLEALEMLVSLGTKMHVVLVGSGNLQAFFKEEAKRRGIERYTHFVGNASTEELRKWYQSADVALLPSIHSGEAFGIVQLESMACGTPVIASDLPGVRILANQGGRTVAPGSAISLASVLESLQKDKQFWDKKRKEVANIVHEKYEWEKIIDDLEDLYEKGYKQLND